MSKIIFRRIGGRIIPIRVGSSKAIGNEALKASADIRNALKAKISAKTSLSEKRIDAIASVRDVIPKIKKFAENTNWFKKQVSSPAANVDAVVKKLNRMQKKNGFIGEGANTIVFNSRGKAVKTAKKFDHGDLPLKSDFDISLSRFKITPETFQISTGSKTFLVQPRGKHNFRDTTKVIRQSEALDHKINRLGITPVDLFGYNIMNFKGHQKAIDTGLFQVRGSGSLKLRRAYPDRFKKFVISYKKQNRKG